MILYFSGTGNSAYVAERLGIALQDDVVNLLDKLKHQDTSPLQSTKPWILVSPTYAWRIPRILEDWLIHAKLLGNQTLYVVMTCGGSIGNANNYLARLSEVKKLQYMGCLPILMPDNYITMYKTPTKEVAVDILNDAEKSIQDAIDIIKQGNKIEQENVTIKDKLNSGIVNRMFYPMFVHAKKFYVSDACCSCGKCETLCPLQNIQLVEGKPRWKDTCTHCMSCICLCPSEAIEYGKKTSGRIRYQCPKHITK